MGEVDFILNREEQRDLIGFLLDQRLVFIPSIWYEKKKYIILSSLTDIEEIIESNALNGIIFLPFKKSKPYKFELRSVDKDDGILYYINPRQSTPCIDFLPCFYRKENKPILYTSGFISYYPSYYWDNFTIETKVPDEVKDLYKRVNKYLRSVCKRCKTEGGVRSYWVGKKAAKEFVDGTAQNILELDIE